MTYTLTFIWRRDQNLLTECMKYVCVNMPTRAATNKIALFETIYACKCDAMVKNTYRNIRRLVYSWRMPRHVPVLAPLAFHSPLPELDLSRCAVALKENTHATCIYNNKLIRVGPFARKNWDVCGHWLSGNIAHKQTQRKSASAIVHK